MLLCENEQKHTSAKTLTHRSLQSLQQHALVTFLAMQKTSDTYLVVHWVYTQQVHWVYVQQVDSAFALPPQSPLPYSNPHPLPPPPAPPHWSPPHSWRHSHALPLAAPRASPPQPQSCLHHPVVRVQSPLQLQMPGHQERRGGT